MVRLAALFALLTFATVTVCRGQQLEPRRWAHLPIGVNFLGGGYAYTDAEISFDPVLRIEGAGMVAHTYPVKYIRTFQFAGRTARIDWINAYQEATWSGLLDGTPTSVSRSGWTDMNVRFAINLIGAPPLTPKEFAEYRATVSDETLVGLGLVVHVPTGEYFEDKLLNLGTNRWTFRPQLGVVRSVGKWSTELTGSTWIYTDNDDFFNGRYLEQKPLYTLQGHLDYTFRPGLWAGTGIGYGTGGRSTIDGIRKNDRKENLAWVGSIGVPFSPSLGMKVSYIGTESFTEVGADSHSLLAALSYLW